MAFCLSWRHLKYDFRITEEITIYGPTSFSLYMHLSFFSFYEFFPSYRLSLHLLFFPRLSFILKRGFWRGLYVCVMVCYRFSEMSFQEVVALFLLFAFLLMTFFMLPFSFNGVESGIQKTGTTSCYQITAKMHVCSL